MRIGEYKSSWTDAAVRRLIRDLGGKLDGLFAIHRADVSALASDHQDISRAVELRARIHEIETHQDILALTSPLDGNDIMKLLGLRPGAKVKAAKDFLTRAVVDGSLGPDDRAGAEALLRRNFGDNNNS
jgi:poly(A) polymerase